MQVGYGLEAGRSNQQALILDELSGLHEDALARYGLRLSQWSVWQAAQGINLIAARTSYIWLGGLFMLETRAAS